MKIFLALLLSAFSVCSTYANVNLPAIIGEHMVLQQNDTVTLWGWANPLEEITITPGWKAAPVKVTADHNATWRVQVPTPAAGGPYSLTFQGYNTIKFEDVLIGEVWLCSGQSNMEWTARAGIEGAEGAIREANYPEIRFFNVTKRTSAVPQLDLEGAWVVCTPQTMPDFSAVGYFFGRQLHKNLQRPVGLINSSWGGTPAEVWINPDALAQDPSLVAAARQLPKVPWGPEQPGLAYHAMIAPLIPYRLAGALWYQGEANTVVPEKYADLLPAMIRNWRTEWGQEFPFYYVQIAPYKYDRPLAGVLLRDAQRQAMATPRTGMVVISDIGNANDIHPRNKLDVGLRLAGWALNQTYGQAQVPYSGPLYRDMKVEGRKIRLYFDHAEKGLLAKGGALTHFEVAGEDRDFVPAQAKIDGNTVVVRASGVKKPVAVRFAWSNTAEPNLFNTDGLPASAFRTDHWEIDSK
ncbi:sialate O-acetylesterase [Catalinimonas alkaloidigena]|uniref:Sialate O-acetylesterase n=1 Tax=Catalinimonas alkaloidigena TaxID=1075417 RepID=A0A1G9S6A3_9BACT|nr:sialate O-acetylesterase [Catalinimonas alkaloidigena]SDM30847.1 sialate O-acetylesterase [Catalinimonas alkaloidigena]